MFARKGLKFMIKNSKNMLTPSLLGGGLNNTIVCLNKINNNYGVKSLRD